MLGQHVRCRLRNDATIATTTAALRIVSSTVLRHALATDLLSFGLADTHLHLIVFGRGGCELARRVEISLTKTLWPSTGFQRRRVKEISSQWHLYSAFKYALGQDEQHELENDPLREGTNLPDLLGLRVIGSYTRQIVRAVLPRIHRQHLLEKLGVEALEPADGPAEQIPDAAAAAVGLPDLRSKSRLCLAARRAAVAILGDHLRTERVADLLECHRATVARLRAQPASASVVRAVRLQLGLRRALAARFVQPIT